MSATIRNYVEERAEFEYRRGYSGQELEAAKLRMGFFKKFIVMTSPHSYRTQVERDWAYIAKREYNYDVVIGAASYGGAATLLLWNGVMFATKSVPLWPLAAFVPAYLYFRPLFLLKYNKKLFDMCNVGEEYELGAARNQVLAQCNDILQTEDF
jgi:hypothetical protein